METLIVCFVLSPIMFKGKRIVDELVELTQDQVKSFEKVKPSPIRVVSTDNREFVVDANSQPEILGIDPSAGDDTQVDIVVDATEPPPPTNTAEQKEEPKVEPDVDPKPDNEPAAKAEAKTRNKAAKS